MTSINVSVKWDFTVYSAFNPIYIIVLDKNSCGDHVLFVTVGNCLDVGGPHVDLKESMIVVFDRDKSRFL